MSITGAPGMSGAAEAIPGTVMVKATAVTAAAAVLAARKLGERILFSIELIVGGVLGRMHSEVIQA
ncbi:hypothetical protein GCM10027403_23180 [Arthrobacter tecti]